METLGTYLMLADRVALYIAPTPHPPPTLFSGQTPGFIAIGMQARGLHHLPLTWYVFFYIPMSYRQITSRRQLCAPLLRHITGLMTTTIPFYRGLGVGVPKISRGHKNGRGRPPQLGMYFSIFQCPILPNHLQR